MWGNRLSVGWEPQEEGGAISPAQHWSRGPGVERTPASLLGCPKRTLNVSNARLYSDAIKSHPAPRLTSGQLIL